MNIDMRRLRAGLIAVVAVAAGTVAVPAVGTASALAAAKPAALTGYRIVDSAPVAIPPGRASAGGQVNCPAGTVPWGGGVGFTGGTMTFGESISSSAPTAGGWAGRFSNSGTRTGDHFVVTALCASPPPGYSVVTSQVDNPPGATSTATASCPAGFTVLGGGASSTATTSDVQLLSAWPLNQGQYRAVMSNGSATGQKLTAFAICALQPAGYTVVTQTSTSHLAPVVLTGGAQCPAGTSLIGGGIQIGNPRPAVALGASTQDSGPQWFAEVLIQDQVPATVTISAICAS